MIAGEVGKSIVKIAFTANLRGSDRQSKAPSSFENLGLS